MLSLKSGNTVLLVSRKTVFGFVFFFFSIPSLKLEPAVFWQKINI